MIGSDCRNDKYNDKSDDDSRDCECDWKFSETVGVFRIWRRVTARHYYKRTHNKHNNVS